MSDVTGILVTGGAGFIGATLVRGLVECGYRVRVLDNLSTGDPAYLAGVDADLRTGDIRDDGALDDAVTGCDAIIHLAAAGSVIGSVADPASNFEVNVTGTFRVLEAARRNGVPRVVQASTGGALIGDAPVPVDERSLPKPLSPYGASKLAGEGYAHAFAKTYGMRTVAVRFGNVYGPWCGRKRGVLNAFFTALHTGRPLVIYGDGTATCAAGPPGAPATRSSTSRPGPARSGATSPPTTSPAACSATPPRCGSRTASPACGAGFSKT
jgi:UDP-glucose 4-epimerase